MGCARRLLGLEAVRDNQARHTHQSQTENAFQTAALRIAVFQNLYTAFLANL